MNKTSSLWKRLQSVDWSFHDRKHDRSIIIVCTILLLAAAIGLRYVLLHATNVDYDIFAGWYDFAKVHGLSTLKYGASDGFSNYNPPYNYLLYLTTLLPVSKIVAIKGLLVIFDLLLAWSVYLVVRHLYPKGYTAFAAALGSLFIPTVVATGAYWGQFDQFYTAFILFSLHALLQNESKKSWVYFGLAVGIKLQAIFFLPVLVIMSMKHIKWWDAVWGALAFAVVTLPPLFFGRSLSSLLAIYGEQTTLFKDLTLAAPNIYIWFPGADFDMFRKAGIVLTFTVLVMLFLYAVYYKKYTKRDILLWTALMLLLVPFLLPLMHERYFFPASIGIFLLLLVNMRYLWMVAAVQLVVMLSYAPFLFHVNPFLPFSYLALGNLLVIGAIFWELIQPEIKNISRPKQLY